jgi:hypothetical protein
VVDKKIPEVCYLPLMVAIWRKKDNTVLGIIQYGFNE